MRCSMTATDPPPAESPGGVLTVHVNGEARSLARGVTVSGLLENLGLDGPAIAVEVNRTIIPRRAHGEHRLEDGDRVEIVTFVGGG